MNNMNKTMKRVGTGLLAGMMAMSCMACGKTDSKKTEESKQEEKGGQNFSLSTVTGDVVTLTSNNTVSGQVGVEQYLRDNQTVLKGDGTDVTTIMIYMNGSNLESEAGCASFDIEEMIDAGYSDQVNILIQTMGTDEWQNYDIATDHSQIYKVVDGGIELVNDDLDYLELGTADSVESFVSWSAANYPADRYDLILWNHGGGPVYGYGSDDHKRKVDDRLTLPELQDALGKAGVHFDFIGFDACLMSGLETCCALYDYCDYTVLSEDFESGDGWYYTPWLEALYKNPSITTPELGEIICDAMLEYNDGYEDYVNDYFGYEGDDRYIVDTTLAIIDESWIPVVYATWIDFAYKNTDALLEYNFSREEEENGRNSKVEKDYGTMLEYYFLTDIMAVAQNIDSEESKALSSALANALSSVVTSESDSYLTGISVTLPYGNKNMYEEVKAVFSEAEFDAEYIEWLGNFVDATGVDTPYDYSDWDAIWNGWNEFINDYDWSQWSFIADPDFWNGLNINWSQTFSEQNLNNITNQISNVVGNVDLGNIDFSNFDLGNLNLGGLDLSSVAPAVGDLYNSFTGNSSSSHGNSSLLDAGFEYSEEEECYYYYDEEDNMLIFVYADNENVFYMYDYEYEMYACYVADEDAYYILDESTGDWICID